MHSMINSEDRTNEVENYRTLEMDRQNGNFNSSGSSHEKNTTVLTLFTYPESSTMKNVSIKLPFSVSKNTAIQVQQPLSKPRTHRIIDKLSELTNIKLRNAASAKYRNLGHVHEPKLINGSAQSTKNEYNIISNFNISLDYALKRKPDERSSASLTSLSNKSTVKTLTNGSFTATSPGGEHLSPHAENKEPIAYKVSTGSTMTNASANLPVNNADSETLEHVSEESRVITADQIGMNRPTRVPFHFTTTQFPPITTTVREITPAIHSQKVPSPHNHIFAPTQDPINIAHGEDVNGDDLKDFHVAHLTFVAAPEDLRDNKSYFPPPQSNESNNFNSATGHNHLIKKSNNINEQLPFFKEQGGIFEHHQQPNLQNGPNEIQQRQKIAGVTYASKARLLGTSSSTANRAAV
ncbi:unnamed protein product [Allacma fusca]|uniref:Uncharacterized protein n=1 Tax=Allacma fusca TaxID=39272 RepID=A0A8J2NWI8_9HEXA|nr:unnamed protein product [Allacma fusca]